MLAYREACFATAGFQKMRNFLAIPLLLLSSSGFAVRAQQSVADPAYYPLKVGTAWHYSFRFKGDKEIGRAHV